MAPPYISGGRWYDLQLPQDKHYQVAAQHCQNVAIETFPVMIAARGNPPPSRYLIMPYHGPPFAPVRPLGRLSTSHVRTKPTVFALFLRSRGPRLNPPPAASHEWSAFTARRRSHHCSKSACRSLLLSCCWAIFWHHASAMHSGTRAPMDSFPLFRDAYTEYGVHMAPYYSL